jgi:hypothetical protein
MADVIRFLTYVFVETAPQSFPADLRQLIPNDPPLHFVSLVDGGSHQAMAVLNTADQAEADALIDQHFEAAGGSGIQVTYAQTMGTLSLRYR